MVVKPGHAQESGTRNGPGMLFRLENPGRVTRIFTRSIFVLGGVVILLVAVPHLFQRSTDLGAISRAIANLELSGNRNGAH